MRDGAAVYRSMPFKRQMAKELLVGAHFDVEHVHTGSCLELTQLESEPVHLVHEPLVDHFVSLMLVAGVSAADFKNSARRIKDRG